MPVTHRTSFLSSSAFILLSRKHLGPVLDWFLNPIFYVLFYVFIIFFPPFFLDVGFKNLALLHDLSRCFSISFRRLQVFRFIHRSIHVMFCFFYHCWGYRRSFAFGIWLVTVYFSLMFSLAWTWRFKQVFGPDRCPVCPPDLYGLLWRFILLSQSLRPVPDC